MQNKYYYNKNGDELYILHFPGNSLENQEHVDIIAEELNREIKISPELSIISIMDRNCAKESPIIKQCEKNSIPVHNSALNELTWKNTAKIPHILETLEEVSTPYVLILDGRDTVIVNNLDDNFLEKYKSFGKPIVYNGTPVAYPKVAIEDIREILSIKGKQKFLNAGVCIGEKDALIDFYTKAQHINASLPNNKSEQYIIRLCRKKFPNLVGIDHDNYLTRIVHNYDTEIQYVENGTILI